MKFNRGSKILIQSDNASHGLTGIIDEIDDSHIPYHVTFDIPRDGVESTWFAEEELVEIQRGHHTMTTADILEAILARRTPVGYTAVLGFEDWYPKFQGHYIPGNDVHSHTGESCIACSTKLEAVIHCWQHFITQEQEAQI